MPRLLWIEHVSDDGLIRARRSATVREFVAWADEQAESGWKFRGTRRCLSCRKRLGWWERPATGQMRCARCGFHYPDAHETSFSFFPEGPFDLASEIRSQIDTGSSLLEHAIGAGRNEDAARANLNDIPLWNVRARLRASARLRSLAIQCDEAYERLHDWTHPR